ncbi:hypothetical protein M527_21710 [Sphingobium indicum IP26]|nr:hypothetical protein M527_21710 [Sphingobium indicum IP26]
MCFNGLGEFFGFFWAVEACLFISLRKLNFGHGGFA